MTSRLHEDSASVSTTLPGSAFAVIPTQESLVGSQNWEVYPSVQDPATAGPNDVIEWNVPGAPDNSFFQLSESYVELKFRIPKTARIDGAAFTADTEGNSPAAATQLIAPVVGMPEAAMFKRMALLLQGTPVAQEYDFYNVVSFCDAMLNRTKSDLRSNALSQGWQFSELNTSAASVGTAAVAQGTLQLSLAQNLVKVARQNNGDVINAAIALGTTVRVSGAVSAGGSTGWENLNGKLAMVVQVTTAAGGNPGSVLLALCTEGLTGTTNGFNCTLTTMEDLRQTLGRPSSQMPLVKDLGALRRRADALVGGNTAIGDQPTYSYKFQPCIGAWKSGDVIPSDVSIRLRAVLNDKDKLWINYGGGPAGDTAPSIANLGQIQIDEANLFLRRVIMAPATNDSFTQMLSSAPAKINNLYIRSTSMRFTAGTSIIRMNNILSGPKARRYVVWSARADAVEGPVPGGMSPYDLFWDRPEGADAGKQGAAPKQMRLTINSVDYPTRMIKQVSIGSGADTNFNRSAYGSKDESTAYLLYKAACASPNDPALTEREFNHNHKIYVFDTEIDPDATDHADPVLENVNVLLQIEMDRPLLADRIVGVFSYNDSVIECSSDKQISSDQS